MKLDWNTEKNIALKETRHINFADIALLINAGLHYSITDNPGPKYPHQKVMTLIIDEYAYCIPCVEIE